jgi:RimJ/RimL family protein N-acetyltransferase
MTFTKGMRDVHPAPPFLETARLRLRSMQPDDVDSLLAIFADPKVMASFGVPPFDRAQMTQWVQRNLDHQVRHGYGLFSVLLKTDGLLIGDCGLEWMEVDGAPAAELGYDFRSDYWNQGYATEAAGAVRGYAFGQLRLPRLTSLIRVGNIPSQRVAEKIGMRYTDEITRDGRRYWHYELKREMRIRFETLK